MAANVWEKRIASYANGEPITKSLCNRLKSMARLGTLPDGAEYSRTNKGWALMPDHVKQGQAWMKKANPKFKDCRFVFMGILMRYNSAGYPCPVIIYRAMLANGQWIDYIGASGPLEVVNHG